MLRFLILDSRLADLHVAIYFNPNPQPEFNKKTLPVLKASGTPLLTQPVHSLQAMYSKPVYMGHITDLS